MPKKQTPRRPQFQQKQSFDWQQNDSHLVILIPCGILQQRDLNVEVSDLCVRISNSKKPSQTYVLDLLHQIDISSLKNKAVVRPGQQIIELVLQKKEPDVKWEELEFIAESREQLIERRNNAFERLRVYEEEMAKKAKDMQIKLDKSSVEEQMRVEGEQRDLLKRRQEQEKRQAEDEMYEVLEGKYSSGALVEEEVKEEENEVQEEVQKQSSLEVTQSSQLPPP